MDRMKIRQIQLQENSLFTRLALQLSDRLVCFLGTPRREVNRRVVR